MISIAFEAIIQFIIYLHKGLNLVSFIFTTIFATRISFITL